MTRDEAELKMENMLRMYITRDEMNARNMEKLVKALLNAIGEFIGDE